MVLTTRCNLQCLYCYYGKKSSAADMPVMVIKQALSLAALSGVSFHLQLTGGEPTLVPALIKEAAVLAHDTAQCCSMGIQTNGTCLTPNLVEILKKYQIKVGVSLDGPPAVHEQQRGMAAETLRGLKLLERAGIPFRVTTGVAQASLRVLDRLILPLAGFACARGIGLDLLVNKGRTLERAKVSEANNHSLQKGLKSMMSTLDAVNAHRKISIRFRERDLLMKSGQKINSFFCHACIAQSMAVKERKNLTMKPPIIMAAFGTTSTALPSMNRWMPA